MGARRAVPTWRTPTSATSVTTAASRTSSRDPSAPNVARMAALSVDYNELLALWMLDNAGAPAVDGNASGDGDPLSTISGPGNCTPLPAPGVTGISEDVRGANVIVSFGDVSGIRILDDCAIAETRATNCPRN